MLTEEANKIVDTVNFTDPMLREHAIMIMKYFKESMVKKGVSKIDIKSGDNEPVENETHSYVDEDEIEQKSDAECCALPRDMVHWQLDLSAAPTAYAPADNSGTFHKVVKHAAHCDL